MLRGVRARWDVAKFIAVLHLVGCSSPTTDAGVGDAVDVEAATADSANGDAGSDAGADSTRCPDYNATHNLYWGDLHTHTALSADAYGWGNRNFPHDAYQFATHPSAQTPIAAGAPTPGPSVSIDRPLDWDAVTDHSEWLGATWGCGEFPDGSPLNPASTFGDSPQCVAYRAQMGNVNGINSAAEAAVESECNGGGTGDPSCQAFLQSAWQLEIQAAHDANQPCTFTPLVAFEWTHQVSGAMLHQNVIFNSENVPTLPLDSTAYPTTSDLWTGLDTQCTAAMGCQALTIPHNPNLSDGMAYQIPSGVDAIAQMNQYQRLTEIHQHKGGSECFAGTGATDPTCAFEHVPAAAGGGEAQNNFVRHALEQGILSYGQQRAAGGTPTNPMQMGIIGATDDHNGVPGYVAEDTWQGHLGLPDDTPAGRLAQWFYNPGGITGVWAEQNTRDAIFAALMRRETFATSGPRIAVRFFQVWNSTDYCSADGGGGGFPGNIIAAGGIPMGGTMVAGTGSPQFVVDALQDATPLAEVDIIRATLVAGALSETVTRFMPTSPGTTWSGGSVCLQWTDGAYDATQPAFYYVRVLQSPTWRWSHYDCQVDPTASGCGAGGNLDVMIQERAWTSPIWWLP